MKLSVKAAGLMLGLMWAGAVLLIGAAFVFTGHYGRAFLELCASIYPGYYVERTFSSVLIGAIYALVDGTIGGALMAWLYNRLAAKF